MLVLHAGLHPRHEGAARENPDVTEDEAREYLAGNLCRCGSYVKIMKSVLDARDRLAAERSAIASSPLSKALEGLPLNR